MRPDERITTEWRNRVAAEYRSAALTAQVVHWMIIAAFPEELIHAGLRIVSDELDHARLSHECLLALGGEDDPAVLDARQLAEPTEQGILAGLVDSIVRNFCLGETLAVPLFATMRRSTTHPAAEPVLTRVLADETRHRQFGWDALDELLDREPEDVRARVAALLPGFLDGFRELYAPEGTSPELTEAHRAAGLMDLAAYRDVFWTTVRGDLNKRFTRRGIPLPDGYLDA